MRYGAGHALIPLTALSFAGPGRGEAATPSPEVCYIANAGFAVRAPQGTVLIDALIRDGLPDYPKASDSLNEKMEKGLPPFDDVRIVIASHAHADHFNAAAVARHAAHNPDTLYVLTPQARDLLVAAGFPAGAMKRINSVYPANHEAVALEHAGFRVTIYRVNHGRGVPAENIGTLIEAGGVRLFHPGDMTPYAGELAEAGLVKLGVDVALTPFWLLMDDASRAVTVGAFAAKTIIPMHLPVREQEQMAAGGPSELRQRRRGQSPERALAD